MIYILALLYKGNNNSVFFLSKETKMTDFNWFQRKYVREFMTFSCRECIKAMDKDKFITFNHELEKIKYNIYGFTLNHKLYCAMITNDKYPAQLCKGIGIDLLKNFVKSYPKFETTKDINMPYKRIKSDIIHYEKSSQFDKMEKIQKDIEEVKGIMIQNIDKILEKGEKLDELVEKSNDLSQQSKMFYKQANKMNSCCIIL